MAIDALRIIGESINDSVPSTHQLYEAEDFDAIGELAHFQSENGASVIDVNVGSYSADVMRRAVEVVQRRSSLPLSIDTPDPELAEAGLLACDPGRGKPILNSISPLRVEMFELYDRVPFRPILLVSERRLPDGSGGPCHSAEETYEAALQLFELAKSRGIPNDDIFFDAGIAPLASDTEGNLPRLLASLEMIHNNPEMRGVHASVGLSNFTVMLPPKRKVDGSPVKSPLESAFLTLAMPLGLDYVIGSVKRNYRLLSDDDPAMCCVNEVLQLRGVQALKRVRSFYR